MTHLNKSERATLKVFGSNPGLSAECIQQVLGGGAVISVPAVRSRLHRLEKRKLAYGRRTKTCTIWRISKKGQQALAAQGVAA
jgi:hypothetical protein